jgi:hypothetical protein
MGRPGFGRLLAILSIATAPGAFPVAAQGIDGQVGRFYEGEGWDVYRLGVSRPIVGMFGLGLHGKAAEAVAARAALEAMTAALGEEMVDAAPDVNGTD